MAIYGNSAALYDNLIEMESLRKLSLQKAFVLSLTCIPLASFCLLVTTAAAAVTLYDYNLRAM